MIQDGASRIDPDESREDMLEELWHEREIRKVLMRYCRGVDRKDMGLVRSAYHVDAYDDHGTFAGTVDEMIEWMEERHTHIIQSMHCLAQVKIERRSDIAAVESYCVTFATLEPGAESSRRRYIPDPGDDTGQPLQVMTCVRFADRFELRDSAWRIAYRTVVLETIEWRTAPDELLPGGIWTARARRDRQDVTYQLLAELNYG